MSVSLGGRDGDTTVKEYTRSQPTAPNHEDTQVSNFKVY